VDENSVYVQRTSPRTLIQDIGETLSIAGFPRLNPQHRTLIKINGNFDKIYPGSNTSRWFLDGLLRALREHSFRDLAVVEGDLPEFPATRMIRATGFQQILDKYDVPLISYENPERDVHELPTILRGAQLINVPVFHGHGIAVISCATKNLFGLLPKDRRKYHRVLSEKLLDLVRWMSPVFTIVDGTVGLDGESTRRGNPRRLDLLLAGWNPLTLNFVVSLIMGYSTDQVPVLALAKEQDILPSSLNLEGEFTWESLPHYDFTFIHSGIRRTAMTLENTPLFYIPVFLWLEDQLRRLYHHYNYWRKRDLLFSGPWMEYERVSSGE